MSRPHANRHAWGSLSADQIIINTCYYKEQKAYITALNLTQMSCTNGRSSITKDKECGVEISFNVHLFIIAAVHLGPHKVVGLRHGVCSQYRNRAK